MLLDQPVKDSGDRVPLLARRVQICPEDLVDHRLVRIQRGGSGMQLLDNPRAWRPAAHGARCRQAFAAYPAMPFVPPATLQ
ncbi:hypothetical protein [Streptomyces sp. NPDC004728]|uniref:hypothetical protein n=1 Tax=Streptomyces sp. NPDC004728 TaxID=3154289 RepID=UPI0033BEDB10